MTICAICWKDSDCALVPTRAALVFGSAAKEYRCKKCEADLVDRINKFFQSGRK